MQQIISFFIRNKNFLLFAVLFLISLSLTIGSHNYHKGKFVTSANFLSGGIFAFKTSITDYFDLKKQNELLTQENSRLRARLSNNGGVAAGDWSWKTDSLYKIRPARVINNSYHKSKNHLTLNQGSNSGLKIDMGVASPQGIVGIVDGVSGNYATVQSLLNTNSQVIGAFKKSNHFGTIAWDTQDPNVVQLNEIPRLAPVALGDTIVTDGKSTIFPPGILIGTVKKFDRDPEQDYYQIDVQLFTDMTAVKHVYVIEHTQIEEIKQLEQQADDPE